MHLTFVRGPLFRMLFVRSVAAGFRMVWAALRVMSKPKKMSDWLTFTAIFSWLLALFGPVKTTGGVGHALVDVAKLGSARQTSPTVGDA